MAHIGRQFPRYPAFKSSMRSDRGALTIIAVAVAALVGTVVGGLSAFAVVNALTPPAPRQETAISAQAKSETPTTVPSTPVQPAAGMAAAPAAPQSQIIAPAQGPQTPWPDALTGVRIFDPTGPAAVPQQDQAAAAAAADVQATPDADRTDLQMRSARGYPAKKKMSRAWQPNAFGRPVYNYAGVAYRHYRAIAPWRFARRLQMAHELKRADQTAAASLQQRPYYERNNDRWGGGFGSFGHSHWNDGNWRDNDD